jgi:hypothetical protein
MQHYARRIGIVQRLSILGQALRQELRTECLFENVESYIVPSVVVLVLGNDSSLTAVADAVVAGAKSVRFTEVSARAMVPDVFRYRRLEDDATLASYDGIVVVAPNDDAIALPATLKRLPEHAASVNTVMGCIGGGPALVAEMLDAGGIVVGSEGPSIDATARSLGARVARVAGWVRHAAGHEAEHDHHDHHHHPGHHHHTNDERL